VKDRFQAGRVVPASVVQASTLGDKPTEDCIASAVRTWQFPKPKGGGLVIVAYPFKLTTK